jgi:hypothetical protein
MVYPGLKAIYKVIVRENRYFDWVFFLDIHYRGKIRANLQVLYLIVFHIENRHSSDRI